MRKVQLLVVAVRTGAGRVCSPHKSNTVQSTLQALLLCLALHCWASALGTPPHTAMG